VLIKRHAGGFTLVEVLIVVVILGILAGIVVYAVTGTTSNASKQACKTEAKQFVNAYAAYQANHGGAVVSGGTTAAMAGNLYTHKVISSATLTYASKWTFNASNATVDTSAC
jgi:prepilin-type N-terminal cleavage/methylation domain-containing protein